MLYVVLVFGSGRKKVLVQFWFKYPEKKRYSRLLAGYWQFFLLWRKIFITTGRKKRYITTGKKRYSRLSDGFGVLAITTGKKKDTVVCVAGSAVVLVFGSGGKLAFFL